jgi:hypothetical protein
VLQIRTVVSFRKGEFSLFLRFFDLLAKNFFHQTQLN